MIKTNRNITKSDIEPIISGCLRKLRIKIDRIKCNSDAYNELRHRLTWIGSDIQKRINDYILTLSPRYSKEFLLMLVGSKASEILDTETQMLIKIADSHCDWNMKEARKSVSPNLNDYDDWDHRGKYPFQPIPYYKDSTVKEEKKIIKGRQPQKRSA